MANPQLRYHPVLADLAELLSTYQVDRLLVIGTELPQLSESLQLIRMSEVSDFPLPVGIYIFQDDSGWALMSVINGVSSQPAMEGNWTLPEDHPLVHAYGWFLEFFNKSQNISLPKYRPGDQIQILPSLSEGAVRSREFDTGQWWYGVRTEGRTQDFREYQLVYPSVDDDPYEWIQRGAAPASDLAATLTRTKLLQQLTDTVYSFRASRTIFRPYQFRPVLRLLESGILNLLVADEVGLGKTIEAGLIWTELEARRQANRVLVVCPSMLVEKWRQEMRERFDFELEELTKRSLDDFLMRLEEDRLPQRLHAIISIERLRVWSGLTRAAELGPRFDLVIVDEAHIFRNAGTKSNALGGLLSDWSDALVFLSATPLNLGNKDLYNLLQLLAPGEFENVAILESRLEPNGVLNRISAGLFDKRQSPTSRTNLINTLDHMKFGPVTRSRPECQELEEILSKQILQPQDIARAKKLISILHTLSAVVTRTRKLDVQDKKAVRSAQQVIVKWTDDEARLYLAIENWQVVRARQKKMPVGFATQMPLRLASSCLPAARDRILNMKSGSVLIEAGAVNGDEATLENATVENDFPTQEVLDAANKLGDIDSKFDSFVNALFPIVNDGKQVLVFTFSRYTLSYLESRLNKRFRFAVMHGDIPRDERHQIIRDFRAGKYDILLATRVASEGLDFEFCSAVVNYDLPWNPMEIEQRIGRIDRIGQKEEKIIILNFHTPGTIETDILERIHSRIGVFQNSIGELEPIIQSRMLEIGKTVYDFTLSKEERHEKVEMMLTAIEVQRMAKTEVEVASSFLVSSDQVEIDGLESTLLEAGRFIGKDELVLLLRSWTNIHLGAKCVVNTDGNWLKIDGNASMADDVELVAVSGERSRSELETYVRRLRDEHTIAICLDQELARTTNSDLISANHPMVRAAIRATNNVQSRFSYIRIKAENSTPGIFLVAIARSQWNGINPTKELWTSAIDLNTGAADESVGNLLLSSLALGRLGALDEPFEIPSSMVRTAISELRKRKVNVETRKQMENSSLIEIRRLSVEESFKRKITQIEVKVQTALVNGNEIAVKLLQAQISRQSTHLKKALDEIDSRKTGIVEMEYVAICAVRVSQ